MVYSLKHRHEFKDNHGEWVTSVKPDFGPGLSERIWEAVRTTGENIDLCQSIKAELQSALSALLGVSSLSLCTCLMPMVSVFAPCFLR